MTRRLTEVMVRLLLGGIACTAFANAAGADMLHWHFPQGAMGRTIAATLIIAVYAMACLHVYLKQRCHRISAAPMQAFAKIEADMVLLAFASQTGCAARLARQSAQFLTRSGMKVTVEDCARLDPAQLQNLRRALFVVSTTGDGDAPDNTAAFMYDVTGATVPLNGLHYGILALGDRSYARYCAFGHVIDTWLQQRGAQRMFDAIEVNNSDEDALRLWHSRLSALSGKEEHIDWDKSCPMSWRRVRRCLLNPGSKGAPAYHLELVPTAPTALRWQAGDIAEITPRHASDRVKLWMRTLHLDPVQEVNDKARQGQRLQLAEVLSHKVLPDSPAEKRFLQSLSAQDLADRLTPLPGRKYSIASLPIDGRMEILVRRATLPDGSFGVCSGWLTAWLIEGGEVDIHVRENSNFHVPSEDVPLILIGNGTGMAGLRAHLKARAAAGRRRNWLLFGERSARHDFFFQNDIAQWQTSGMLQRVDLAFSRDQAQRNYVQDKLQQAGDELRRWVAAGATICLCGSRDGMATGVTQTLRNLLGEQVLDSMIRQGRYRRDVY